MTEHLPTVNAILNSTSAVLLVAGRLAIARGDRRAHRRCMIGAVKDLIMNAHSIDPGLAMCGKATDDYAPDCYGAVGRMHAGLESRLEVRRSNCSRVGPPYRDACAALPPGS